jgi:hypothetical protein
MSEDPIKRYTLLVLFQAQQDHATELAIAPSGGGAQDPIRYKVEGSWYSFSTPPESILPGVVAELGRLAALSEKPFPREGLIDVPFSGLRLRWVARMASADGDCVLTPVEH